MHPAGRRGGRAQYCFGIHDDSVEEHSDVNSKAGQRKNNQSCPAHNTMTRFSSSSKKLGAGQVITKTGRKGKKRNFFFPEQQQQQRKED